MKSIISLGLLLLAGCTAKLDSRVAHAGGAIQGHHYTNSLEALEESFRVGFRWFELDFEWTADDELVLRHDWSSGVRARDLASFHSEKTPGGFTPMDLSGLVEWIRLHPDVTIVTDVKDRNVAALGLIVARYPGLRELIVPQIYSFDEYESVRALGYDRIILTLYRMKTTPTEVEDFARTHRLFAVTTPYGSAIPKVSRVYVHTVNSRLRAWKAWWKGAYGIYTDDLSP